MSFSVKKIHTKLNTQPNCSSSLPKLRKSFYPQSTFKQNVRKISQNITSTCKNPQMLLKKLISSKKQQKIRLKTTSQFFSGSILKQPPTQAHRKILPYPIAASKNLHKKTGLSQQKVIVLQDQNLTHITAQKWLIYDSELKQVIKGYKYKKIHDVASLSKLLTFYTMFNIVREFKIGIDRLECIVMKEDQEILGTRIPLKHDMIVTLQDMIYAMMLNSANNAATVIANNLGFFCQVRKQGKYFSCYDINSSNRRSSIDYFVSLMQKNIKKLKLAQTSIQNPHGMSSNLSSCFDICHLFVCCYSISLFRKIISTSTHHIILKQLSSEGNLLHIPLTLINTNKMSFYQKDCIGGKTGENKIGGNGFVGYFNGQNKIVIVVMGCFGKDEKFRDAAKLYQWYNHNIRQQ